MALEKQYKPKEVEPRLREKWEREGTYRFDPDSPAPVYSIDTPPPTVSGRLHMGHIYSYTHADLIARYKRMNGFNVFYPMGFDDNGLPTERLVEKTEGITARQVGRKAFIERCLAVSEKSEEEYRSLWQSLGLSIDWRYLYSTINPHSRKTSQLSFIELYKQGRAYQKEAPTIWCPECQTAIAQADLDDLERTTQFTSLAFKKEDGSLLVIATTRPELLPACVAVFVHPTDARFTELIGQKVTVPLFGQPVPVIADEHADPQKGTGAVMCCTFGDSVDVEWWFTYKLPLIEAIGRDGKMTGEAGEFAGMTAGQARKAILTKLAEMGAVLGQESIAQSVRVHERCDTPVEYIVAKQWFINVLENKAQFLQAGEELDWHPAHIRARFREWVENLHWDWCISRQRYYGVPFPVWYCKQCGQVNLPEVDELPVDPTEEQPKRASACGSTHFEPERDIMDTWATSSMTPQIVGQWQSDPALYNQVFPFSMRPQAHEIIRTWAFYTIVKSVYHFGKLPWKDVAISGWGLSPKGTGKISKSRGGGPAAPAAMIEQYSADALRYWAGSTGFGKDTIISEEKIQAGGRLVTKLWNVARFSERFIESYQVPEQVPALNLADRWILARLQEVIDQATTALNEYEYAAAKLAVEDFFWQEVTDNYLEMIKQRLYNEANPRREGAQFTLYALLHTLVRLFAIYLPYVTEELFLGLFGEGKGSLHRQAWPKVDARLQDPAAALAGKQLVEIATAVRRYKSEHGLPLGMDVDTLQLVELSPGASQGLAGGAEDLMGITRALKLEWVDRFSADAVRLGSAGAAEAAIILDSKVESR